MSKCLGPTSLYLAKGDTVELAMCAAPRPRQQSKSWPPYFGLSSPAYLLHSPSLPVDGIEHSRICWSNAMPVRMEGLSSGDRDQSAV